MDSSLASLAAKPVRFTVGNEAYDLYPVTFDSLGDIQKWCDDRSPDPFEIVAAQIESGRFTPAQEKHLLDSALRASIAAKPKIGTPECDEMLRSIEGIEYVLWLSVRPGRPDFKHEDARKLMRDLGLQGTARILRATNLDQVLSDPKSPAASGETAPRSPTLSRASGGESGIS